MFAVFDSGSSKTQRSGIADRAVHDEVEEEEEKSEKPLRFDAGTLSVEISGGKRSKSEQDVEPVKKMKKDERTIMTGLTDMDVDENIEEKTNNQVANFSSGISTFF